MLAGGLFSALSRADITFSPLLEGSLTLPAVDLADLWPVHRPGFVSVPWGLPQACSRNKIETGQLLQLISLLCIHPDFET